MPTPQFKAPALSPSQVKVAAPGSNFSSTVSNPTGQPMQVRVGTQTLSGKHCGLSAYQSNVSWAHVKPAGVFTLGPESTRAVSVHVDGNGPGGPHDLIIDATHIASAPHGHIGGTASATVGYQVKVTYPGKPVTVVCKAFAPQKHVHKQIAVAPIQTVSHGISPLLIGGIAAVVLALVVVIAVLFKKLRHSS